MCQSQFSPIYAILSHPIYYIDDCITQCAMEVAVNKKVFALTTNDSGLPTINKHNVAHFIVYKIALDMVWYSAILHAHNLPLAFAIRLIAILYSDDEQLVAR